MEFLKFTVNGIEYGRGTTEIGRAAAKRNGIDLKDDRPANWKPIAPGFSFYDERILHGKWKDEANQEAIRKFFTVLAVCHTVIPEQDRNNPDEIVYQASSPDEAALVKAASLLGFHFFKRTPNSVSIKIGEEEETYEILNVLEFNSTRKRMSVIVRTPDNRIVLMTKGADNVIYERMNTGPYSTTTLTSLKKFAEEGLRTLVIAEVVIDQQQYMDWNTNVFIPASLSLSETKDLELQEAAEKIEKNLELVGSTAIEDKLQDGVPQTIEELARAGIKIWVLTGDKQETAINIGFACALLDNAMETIILNKPTREELKNQIRTQYKAHMNVKSDRDMAVVIDGASLEMVLQSTTEMLILTPTTPEEHPTPTSPDVLSTSSQRPMMVDETPNKFAQQESLHITFLKLCMMCKSVICCRVSPLQKSQVVKLVRDTLKGTVTLAIGDGANDVSMIQAAHIGIGISGQEGLQAARAADYAIGQFRFLKPLLLVHGRYNYRRLARLICYSFYKNLTLQLCQFWYVFFNAFTGTSIYDSNMLLLFNIIFTSVPIIVYAIWDRDVSLYASRNVPQLYMYGQRGYYVSLLFPN
jgi:magnesium-transporting ATPase (P-type)